MTQVKNNVPPFNSLYDPADHFTNAILIGFYNLSTFRFSNFLYDNLLRRLGSNATELYRSNRLFYKLSNLNVRLLFPSVCIFEAIEAALASATKKLSREDIEARVEINRETGDYATYRCWEVMEDMEEPLEFPSRQFACQSDILSATTYGL